MAAKKGNKGVVELLLEHKADVNAKDKKGRAPLHLVALGDYRDLFELLLKQKKFSVNAKDEKGRTLLCLVAKKYYREVVELFLKHEEIDVNAVDEDGCTSLHLAAEKGNKDVVELLLEHKADVNAENHNVGCIKLKSVEKEEDRKKILPKLGQDSKLFKEVGKAVTEKDDGKLDELLKRIKELLKPESKYSFKPGLNYSPDGNDENTTLKIALKRGNEKLIKLPYNYAKENIGVDTEIFKQLKHAKAQQENSQPKSDISNVSVSGNLAQAQGFN
ncbi:MAG: ankyrin repeat domain-containing protein [Wolbachia sp.]